MDGNNICKLVLLLCQTQEERQRERAGDLDREGNDGVGIGRVLSRSDCPSPRCTNSHVDHDTGDNDAEDEGVLEPVHHLVQSDVDTGGSQLLRGGRPFDVDGKGMAEKSLGTVDADTAEEEHEEGEPLESLEESDPEGLLFKTVADHAEGERTTAVEDHDEGDPNAPARHVELIKVTVEQADEEVVGNGENEAGSNGIVWTIRLVASLNLFAGGHDLQVKMYARMEILLEMGMLLHRKRRNSLVKGPL
jgi:hypothetical protein